MGIPSVKDLRALAYPRDVKALRLRPREFAANFCDLHLDLFACAPNDLLVYFLARFTCGERMKLRVGVGYDGPVKVWLDGKSRFADVRGTNPATPDKALIPFTAEAGAHEILAALSANGGRAWGLFLRLLRRDVSLSKLKAGPTAYRMPEWA